MIILLTAAALFSASPAEECKVLSMMIEVSFGIRRSEIALVDEAGDQIGAMGTLYSVGERPVTFFPVNLSFDGPVTVEDEGQLQAFMNLVNQSGNLSLSFPHYAQALMYAEITVQRPALEERFGPLPDSLVDDLVLRNRDRSAWSCALPERVAYATEPAERAVDLQAGHVSFTRPGFSADGQFALIYRASLSTSGVPSTSPGALYGGSLSGGSAWVLLERGEGGEWTPVGHAGGMTYSGP